MSAVGLPNYGPEGSWWPRSALLPMCTRTILCRPAQRAHSAHRLPSPREGRSSISTPLIGSLRRTYGWFVSVVDLVRNGVDDMRAVYRDHPSGSLTPEQIALQGSVSLNLTQLGHGASAARDSCAVALSLAWPCDLGVDPLQAIE